MSILLVSIFSTLIILGLVAYIVLKKGKVGAFPKIAIAITILVEVAAIMLISSSY